MRELVKLAPYICYIQEELKESVDLMGDKPFIVRNDGQIFDIKYREKTFFTDHPYLIIRNSERSIKDIDNLLHDNFKSFEWLYEHTASGYTQKGMRMFVENVIANIDEIARNNEDKNKIISKLIPYRETSTTIFPTGSIEDIFNILININDATNQEFLRFRTQRSFYGGREVSIFFKVSSKGFDWGDIIEKIIFNNRHIIKDISIATDDQVMQYSKTYEADGVPIVMMTPEDFISLRHTPVIESLFRLNKNLPHRDILAEGGTHLECGLLTSPRHIKNLIEDINSKDWDIQ